MRRNRAASDWLWMAALLLLVLLHFWSPPLGRGVSHDSYSISAQGKKAFYYLAREHSWRTVARNTESLAQLVSSLEPPETLCILGPARPPTSGEWRLILDWVAEGGQLVYAARPAGEAARTIEPLDIEFAPLDTEDEDSAIVATDLLAGGDLLWQTDQEIVDPEGDVLVTYDGTVQAVARDYGEGRVVIVATDFIFSNLSLAHGDNGVLAFRLLEEAGDPFWVHFDESLNMTGVPKVVGLLLDPLFRPLTVQLLLLLTVFGWWGSRRFGPLLPRAVRARHNIVDHTDTMGTLYWKSGDGAGVLRLYYRQFISELRLRHHKGREERVLEPIARRMGLEVRDVRKTLREATKTARDPSADRRAAADHIRRLAVIRQAARPMRAAEE